LSLHLVADVRRQQGKVLSPLYLDPGAIRYGNIEVLSYRPETALHLARGAEHGAQTLRHLLHLVRVVHVRGGGYLDERYPQAVQAVRDLPVLRFHLARGVLLEA